MNPRIFLRCAVLAIALLAARCVASPPLLLISMDGFRWDYCSLHPAETPHLRQLAREGISARELIPVYPSNTFPNHYSIVTGLYPAHHGIINNDMFDPRDGRFFHYTQPASDRDPRWWGGEPIWVTAVKQGRKSACYYWVGAESAIEGVRPTYVQNFTGMAAYLGESFEARIDKVVRWLQLPPDERPAVITFYLEETNSAGHKYGPESPELAGAVKLLDGRVGALMDRLNAEHLPVNLIVVSDHGMTPVSPDRVMLLDDTIDLSTVQIDFQSPATGLRPLKGTAEDLVRSLAQLPHAKAYLRDDLPARFHLKGNPRIPEVWIVPEEGWLVETRAVSKVPTMHDMKGNHGFDPIFRSMHGILIANGPSFKTGGAVIDPVENIHIYNLMCAALHLAPAPNDGDDRLVRSMLR